MANSKISALTSATTPLAGTETLPIVQSSATKQVSVANLTVGRAINALSLTTTNGSSIQGLTVGRGAGAVSSNAAFGDGALPLNTTGADNVSIGVATLATNTTGSRNTAVGSTSLLLNSTGSDNSAFGYYALFSATGDQNTGAGRQALFSTTGSNNTAVGYQAGSSLTSGSNCAFFGNAAQPSSVTVSNEYSYGNSSVTSHRFYGNLTPLAAAKGINFTANTPAAGMTSQLLNWYEEGSFTATAVPDTGTITLSTNTLRYTRTGRTVHISGTLVVGSVSSPTNNVYVATLPFSAGLACGGGIAVDGTNAFAGQVGWFINAGQQSLYIYYRDATGAYVASAPIFKAGTVIRIDATYTV